MAGCVHDGTTHDHDWGGWELRPSGEPTLDYKIGRREVYRVWLRQCTSSAEVLDWICQVAGKAWADDACVAGLVRALNDILRPQSNLCTGGGDKRITARRIDELARSHRLVDR